MDLIIKDTKADFNEYFDISNAYYESSSGKALFPIYASRFSINNYLIPGV